MKRTYVVAFLILIAAVAWIATGQMGGAPATAPETAMTADAPEEAASATEDAPVKVRVRRIKSEMVADDIVVNGRTEASRTVQVMAETDARVEKILAERGSKVEQGEVIVKLAADDRHAVLARAREALQQRQIEYNAARGLADKGFNSKVKLATATAELEAAKAELKRATLELERIEIAAPFAGVLEERPVETGSYLRSGGHVATIVDLDPVHITGYVSERRIEEVSVGDVAHATLPDGSEVTGRVSYIAATAQPQTRTFRVEIEVPNPDRKVLEGVTARLRLPTTKKPAHSISPGVLTLADDGSVGVKTVDADGRVEFHAVKILKDTAGRMWVQGIPDNARLITVGQEYVVPGQKVEATMDGEAPDGTEDVL